MGPTWGPSGSYRPQMGPMLATWNLLSGMPLLLTFWVPWCFVQNNLFCLLLCMQSQHQGWWTWSRHLVLLISSWAIGMMTLIQKANYWFGFDKLRRSKIGCHFADGIFKWICLNEKVWISTQISLNCVSNGEIDERSPLIWISLFFYAYVHHMVLMISVSWYWYLNIISVNMQYQRILVQKSQRQSSE